MIQDRLVGRAARGIAVHGSDPSVMGVWFVVRHVGVGDPPQLPTRLESEAAVRAGHERHVVRRCAPWILPVGRKKYCSLR